MQCPFCSEEISSSAKKCRFCGEWINKAEKESGSESNSPAIPAPGKKMAVWKKVLIGIGAFIVVVIILAMWATSGLTEAAQKQLNLIKSGDLKSAYDLTSQDFKKTTSYDGFISFVNSYPSLKNNESSDFTDRQTENNTGTLKGTLKSKDGAVTPVEYKFVKENNEWKILSITLNPTGAGTNVENNNNNSSQTNQNSDSTAVPLGKTFKEDSLGYAIDYPSDWTQEKTDNVTVLFTGPKGAKGYPTVAIQNIASKANTDKGGKYATLDEMVQDMQSQFKSMDKNASFSKIQENDFPMANGTMLKGQVFGVVYNYKGTPIRQMQYCVARNDGLIFYSWAFTVPDEDFNKYENTVKSILGSWQIQ